MLAFKSHSGEGRRGAARPAPLLPVLILAVLCACGKTPRVGTPEFNEYVREGGLVIINKDVPYTSLKTAICYGAAETDIEAAWLMIKDIERYPEFFDRIMEMKIKRREGKNVLFAEALLDVEWPVPNRRVILRFDFDDMARSVDINLVEVIEGPVRDVRAYVRIDEDLGKGWVKLSIQMFLDFDLPFFMNPIANTIGRWTLENWTAAARERIELPLFQEYVMQAKLEKDLREADREQYVEDKLRELDVEL